MVKIKEVAKFFKRYFKGEERLFIISFVLLLISAAGNLLYGYLIGRAVDYTTNGVFKLAIYLLIINMLIDLIDTFFISKYGKLFMQKVCNNIMEKISYSVFFKVGLLPARAFEEKTSGELINRVTNDSGTITDVFQRLLRSLVSVLSALAVFIYVCFHSWIVALEIIIYCICFFLFSKKYLPIIKKSQKSINKEKDKVVAEVNESIRGIREIRALGIRERVNGNIKDIITQLFKNVNKQNLDEKSYYSWIDALNIMLENIAFLTCIILIIVGWSSFAFFMTMTYYIYRFMGASENITELSTTYQKMKVAVERISEIVDNKTYNDISFGDVHKTDIIGNIKFDNITFKYSNKESYVFDNFKLEIPTHKKVAIVGRSGQGKSSIFNLLLRYFEPNKGTIYIDDTPINDFDEYSFNKNIAIIRQEPFLFNRSIIDNFKILNKKLTLNDIRDACKKAEIDDYIMSLPKKYNTIIGEGGGNVSGGQKQRMAIARALLKGSKIILFDEATSALDNENQSKINKTIKALVKDHTIVIIAHRLSTIVDADVIFLIDGGKVVAHGTHEELLKKNRVYKTLYQSEQ